MNLQDKTIVLTGACGGIGACIAREFASAGARLILVGRDPVALEVLRGELVQGAAEHLLHVANLCDEAEREGLAQVCAQAEVDILINNAGIGEFNLLEDSGSQTISHLIDLNLNVPIQLTRLILPTLKARRVAALINIGSALGSIGYPGYSVYGASKSGLRGFSEALRRELSDTAVRVLHFSPRATNTRLNHDKAVAMNAALGTAMDTPESVAKDLLKRVQSNRWQATVFGWPEKFYAFLNGISPSITDGSIQKQLPHVKRYVSNNALDDVIKR